MSINENGGYRVGNFDKGQNVGIISAAWSKYGPHEKFMSLTELLVAENKLYDSSYEHRIPSDQMTNLRAIPLQNGQMALEAPNGEMLTFTNWGWNQTCYALGSKPKMLADYPANLAAPCLNHDIQKYGGNISGEDKAKGLTLLVARQGNERLLRSTTSLTYSRFNNASIVKDLIEIVGDGTGRNGTFKIPGKMNWGNMTMNPWAQGDRNDSTIYRAEDGREMLIFLCEDANPIEVPGSRLPDGSPDYYFKGFIIYNSDVGAGKFKVYWFYLRGVCANRNLWGVQDMNSLEIRHTKHAKARFISEFEPALTAAMAADFNSFISAVSAAKTTQIATTDEEALNFLYKKMAQKVGKGFCLRDSQKILTLHKEEEMKPLRTLYDAVQGITAFARREGDQKERMVIEETASKLLKMAA